MKELRGVAASGGIAIGPCFLYQPVNLHVERRSIQNITAECERLSNALKQARQELDVVYEQALAETRNEMASIFQFHMLVLEDPEWLERLQSKIESQCVNAEAALEEVGEEYCRILEGMENEYFRHRSVDVRDIVGRVIRILLQTDREIGKRLKEPSIIIALDLTPSDTITLDKSLVLGFCIAQGGSTSHTAILARELGLPAAVGLGSDLLCIKDGSPVVLDGSKGLLLVDPDEENRIYYQSLSEATKIRALRTREHAHDPVYTQDGRRIEVTANIGSVEGARHARKFGAEGVGLLRTEFLYLSRTRLPTEEEQYQVYREITDVLGDQPVILRTLDIGGDKELPYLDLPQEANPFLGLRGIRLCLTRPDIFEPQLKAALRVMAERNLKIMFPMVTTLAELRAAKVMIQQCRDELIREGKAVPAHFEIGIMIEVPATALLVDQFAPEVDFFSIGTNDLSQYVMAADRTNNAVAALAESFSPAILRLVQEVVRAAHRHGKRVGMCGELAAEPLAIPILLGLGLDEFSMNPPAIPFVKQIIRSISMATAREIASASLQLEDAQEVRKFVKEHAAGIDLG
jgi:phosphoenolpyruvate-protein phosphotransferase